jgi:RNA polymerase sigma-70 factor (ECF subfamily)
MNQTEFSQIVGKTKKIVLAAVREHLPSRFSHALDDVVQETYLRAYRSLVKGAFRNESSMETWLYAIARNEAYRISGRLLREETKAEKAAGIQMLRPAESDEEKNDFEQMTSLIERLSDRHREVFRLLLGGKNEKEISKELSIPPGTVKSRISRGRIELRKLREEEDYEN